MADAPDVSAMTDEQLAEYEVEQYNRLHAALDEHGEARLQITRTGQEMVKRHRARREV